MSMTTVPAFLVKLVNLLEDNENNDIITWNFDGKSFHIYDQSRLAREVLPQYFKHNNTASFIRQLNMYGFRKMIDNSGLKVEHEDLAFSHPFFIRGRDDLLENIKRKVPVTKRAVVNPATDMVTASEEKFTKEDVHHVLAEVKGLKSKQLHMESKIGSLKRENDSLWREVATLKQKHQRQQVVVNKLITFLVRAVGSRGVPTGSKRKLMPLMIESSDATGESEPSRKVQIPTQYYDVESPTSTYYQTQGSGNGSISKGGVTIEELGSPESYQQQPQDPVKVQTFSFDDSVGLDGSSGDFSAMDLSLNRSSAEDLLDDPEIIANAQKVIGRNMDHTLQTSQTDTLNSLTDSNICENILPPSGSGKGKQIKKPRKSDSALKLNIPSASYNFVVKPSDIDQNPNDQMAMSVPTSIHGTLTPEILDSDLNKMQLDINSIKDILSDSYNFGGDTLRTIFNPDEPIELSKEALLEAQQEKSDVPLFDQGEIAGNELIQYDATDDFSSLFDMVDVPPVSDDPAEHDYDLNTPLVTPLSGDGLHRTTSFVHHQPESSKTNTVVMEEVD